MPHITEAYRFQEQSPGNERKQKSQISSKLIPDAFFFRDAASYSQADLKLSMFEAGLELLILLSPIPKG